MNTIKAGDKCVVPGVTNPLTVAQVYRAGSEWFAEFRYRSRNTGKLVVRTVMVADLKAA